ncbi:MAG: 50S ribosomal protein L15 [Candidatus Omnitrophota bacterium]|nr:50S ribosomal protein L15 [Candidatus Omnitrophota bacterium]MDZ4242907.1 50S ribosomal protein L15 [Candidatus Omnitrophota bacterium]
MQLHQLLAPKGATKRRKIVGRGRGSGHGKTSCKGHKGQNARKGRGILGQLEGGQMPLIRRLPKVGFRSKRPLVYQEVNLEELTKFKAGSVVDARTLKAKGLIKNIFKPFKILGDGDLKNALTVHAYSFSKTAAEKIQKAGGKLETVTAEILKKQEETASPS